MIWFIGTSQGNLQARNPTVASRTGLPASSAGGSRRLRHALAAWALALPLLALLAPAAEANSPGCSRAGGNYQAHEDWALTPSTLDHGDKFRLLFASSTNRNARDEGNAPYNTFVRNRAKAGHSGITDGCASKFNALISTRYGDSAKTNTSTGSSDTDASIWWIAGDKVADDYADFYDGSWDSRNHKNENGGTTSHEWVWTGSNSDGTRNGTHHTKRHGNVMRANLNSGNPLFISYAQSRNSAQLNRIFGLSPIFTVVKDPRLSLSLAKASANEGNSNSSQVIITVELDKARSTDTSFKLCVKNTSTATFRTSTSTQSHDFDLHFNLGNQLTVDASNCHTMTLKKNIRYGYVRLLVYGDTLKEEHETVVLELKSPPSNVKIASSKGTATYTITNDDSEPTVTITGGATASEGTNATFTVKSSHAPTQALSVKVNITEEEDANTEKNHVDAADEGVHTVTVAAGSTTKSFTVPTSEDWVDEPDGVITATVQAGTGYVVGSPKSAQVNVEDDDTRGLEFRPTKLTIKEEGSATYTVQLTSQPVDVPEGVTVTLSATGDLTVDTDSKKAGNQTTLLFHATGGNLWQSGQTVKVTAGEDADQTDDASNITHSAAGADYGSVTKKLAVTVDDIDVPNVVVTPSAITMNEGASATFDMKLATQPAHPVNIALASTNTDLTFSPAAWVFQTLPGASGNHFSGWDVATTVTVSAASDNDIADDTATLTITPSGSDYEAPVATVTATVTDTTTPELVLSPSTLSVMEDASTTYTVALAAKPTGAVTVAIGSNNNDVTVDTDTGTDGNQNRLTFQPSGNKIWSTAQTVTVNARGDANTASEAVTLTHTASGGGYNGVKKTLSGTVTDDGKKTIAFSQLDYSVIEGKEPVTVTLVLSEARSSTLNVRVSATPITATGNGVDYTGLGWTVTFPAGSTSATFEIPITEDNILEDVDGETVRLDIHDFDFPNDLKRTYPDLAYANIYDAAVLSFTRPQTTTVVEGVRPLEFTLNARAPYFDEADGSHGYAHVRQSGRARAGIDYKIEYWYPGIGWQNGQRWIAIPAGKPSARVRVTALADGRKKGRETATLTLIELPQVYRDSGQPFYRAWNPRTVTFTVADRETVAPRVESIAHHAPATSTAVSPASLTWRVTFDEEVHDVDASDFTLTGTSATLAVDRGAGTTFDVTASGGNLGSITGGQVVLGFAHDNDITDGSGNAFARWNEFTSTYWVHDGTRPTPPATLAVEFGTASSSAAEDAGTHNVTVNLSSPAPSGGLTLAYGVTGTATAGSGNDFTIQNSGTLSVAAGATSATIPVVILNDSTDEPDETVILTLTGGTGYTVGSPSSTTIAVRDDDPTVASLARTGSGAVTEGDKVEFTVTLGRVLVTGETIDVPLTIGGTGVTTDDWSFTPKPGATNTGVTLQDTGTTTPKVRFEGAGAQEATLELTATADGTAESSETFTIALGANSAFDDSGLGTNVGGGADPHGTDNTFDVTVNDGAAPPPGTPAVEFALASSSAAEDAGTHNVTVNLAPAVPSGGLTLSYAVTGTATAGSGNDFTIQNSGALVVAAGATTAIVPIAINDDNAEETDETVVLTLTSDTGYTLGTTTVHTLTIADNDDPITPAACVSAQLLSDVQGYAGETWRTSPDHVSRWSRVLAAFGESNSYSNNPMTASEARTQAARGLPRWVPVVTALECLENNPPPSGPQITVQGGSAVTEGGNAVFTVSASPAPAASLTVSLTVADDGSSDFLAQSDEGTRTVTIAGGQTSATLTVQTQNDSTDEANGSVTASVTGGTGYSVGSPSTATVAVADNDPTPQGTPVVRIAAGAGVTEGIDAQFTLTASPVPASSITVNVAVTQSGDFATSGQTGARTVTIGSSGTATLTVATGDDSTDEPDGSITATVQTGSGYTPHGTQNTDTVAVADDDVPVVRVTGGSGVTEGASASFTVSASPVPAAPLDVTLSITQSGDFAASGETGSKTVTIPVTGSTTVEVDTVDDSADEPNGSVTASVAAGTGYTVAAAPNHEATVAVSDNDAAPGAPTISVADATFKENQRKGPFTVTLSKPVDWPVSVRYATRESTPVSAVAGQDYLEWERVWRLPAWFRPGETEIQIHVRFFNDSHDEGPETFELVLFDAAVSAPPDVAVEVSIADGVAVGTITNSDPMPKAWLGRFGRTVAQQALDGIASRLAASRTPGAHGTLAGQSFTLQSQGANDTAPDDTMPDDTMPDDTAPETSLLAGLAAQIFPALANGDGDAGTPGRFAGAPALFGEVPVRFGRDGDEPGALGTGGTGALALTLQDVLLGSHFSATSRPDAHGGSFAFWGQAAQATFDGREGSFALDGETTTAQLGTDYARDRWLVGVSLLQSQGTGGYDDQDAAPPEDCAEMTAAIREVLCDGAVREGAGAVKVTLTAAVPYAAFQASERLKLWGAAGYGAGEVTLTPETGGTLTTDIAWTMAQMGMRGTVLAPPATGSGPALAVTSDALWAQTTSAQVTGGLAASAADVTRLRLGLEGSWQMALERWGQLTPTLAVGARHDGGEAETGFGVELGGGLDWQAPEVGVALNVEGRTLLTHRDEDFRDQGVAASFAYDPDPETPRGPSLTLRQDWGGQATGGLDALFASAPLTQRTGAAATGSRWAAEAAWGFPAFGGRFTGSPHVGVGLAAGARDYTLGWRLVPATPQSALSLALQATRRELDAAQTAHTVGLEVTTQW